ncbi:MAG: YajQ family cyclic di-GMP-binding protein [Sulfobacillus acidophilus]|uniref:Nucleotide-binding protein C7B45_09360 n=1 Tax=Sulfobacillus acidophilus TaxID=53633 RepID=A0A2T2WHR1_9FIRM|nr:MAG: YajQ family cyclic di-GMP-binding protein [Sulfobacillus acidophilus]
MPKESSFDIVSEPNWSEVLNALDQTRRETSTRYDFRGHDITVEYDASTHQVVLDAPEGLMMDSLKAVLGEKMARRQVSLKFLDFGPAENHGMNRQRLTVTIKSGIETEIAKKIQKAIRGLGLKVESQIQGNAIRVSGKNRDDLQAVIQHLKGQDFGIELVFNNFRTA